MQYDLSPPDSPPSTRLIVRSRLSVLSYVHSAQSTLCATHPYVSKLKAKISFSIQPRGYIQAVMTEICSVLMDQVINTVNGKEAELRPLCT